MSAGTELEIDGGTKLVGWLPIRLELSSADPVLRWARFGEEPPMEPFFRQTVKKKRALAGYNEHTTGLKELMTMSAELPPVEPNGVIFHVSRCGSTAVANAVRGLTNALIIAEAQPVSTLFAPSGPWNRSISAIEWDQKRANLLVALSAIYASNYATGTRALIIKTVSWNILAWRVIRTIWPTVPILIVIRHPVEVMVSNLRLPAGWVRWPDSKLFGPGLLRGARSFGWKPLDLRIMDRFEYCARAVGRFCEAGLDMLDEHCHVLDYSSLNLNSVHQVAQFFRLHAGREHDCRAILTKYSKDPEMKRLFRDDSAEKQRSAPYEVISAADRWAVPPYMALRKRCFQ